MVPALLSRVSLFCDLLLRKVMLALPPPYLTSRLPSKPASTVHFALLSTIACPPCTGSWPQTTLLLQHKGVNPALYRDPTRWVPLTLDVDGPAAKRDRGLCALC